MILTRRDQRLGDLVAGTIVLRERGASATAAVPVGFPPPSATRATSPSLDVSALTAEQYGADPHVPAAGARPDVAGPLVAGRHRCGNAAAGQVRHPRLPASPPEMFLVCVASAYQRRHGR